LGPGEGNYVCLPTVPEPFGGSVLWERMGGGGKKKKKCRRKGASLVVVKRPWEKKKKKTVGWGPEGQDQKKKKRGRGKGREGGKKTLFDAQKKGVVPRKSSKSKRGIRGRGGRV